MDTCKERGEKKTNNYIFIFAKKKEKKKARPKKWKSVKEIIFWEEIFISCLSSLFKMSCVLSQLFHFILFYVILF